MKTTTTLVALLFIVAATPALADGHQQPQREASRTEAKPAEGDQVKRTEKAMEPRGGESKAKPKPKPKPPKESGEKGGTEDMNIGIGELQEC